MHRLRSIDEVPDVLLQPLLVIFKHSTRCPVSSAAYSQVQGFLESNPQAPVCLVDVIEDREISTEISRITSVRHESPQVLLLKDGRVVWHASHYAVTEEAITRELLMTG